MDPITLMLLLQGAGALAGGASSIFQARAQRSQGRYERRIAELNAAMAREQAQDAIRRGEAEVTRQRLSTKQLIGEQRVAAAGQGIDVGVGSPMDLQSGARALSAYDIDTIRNNAYREAFGYRMQASQFESQGRRAARAGRAASQSTLLTGGLDVARSAAMGAYLYSRRGRGGGGSASSEPRQP